MSVKDAIVVAGIIGTAAGGLVEIAHKAGEKPAVHSVPAPVVVVVHGDDPPIRRSPTFDEQGIQQIDHTRGW